MTEHSSQEDILAKIRKFASIHPNKIAYSWLDDNGAVVTAMTYAEIETQSSGLSSYLSKHAGINRGDRILLVYPPSLQFIVAFLACLKAGLIAVPVFPPDPNKLNKDIQMFSVITSSCDAKTALTSSSYSLATKLATIKSNVMMNMTVQWPTLEWIITDSIISDTTLSLSDTKCDMIETAFLQYTSGSTSDPKGVIITQKALAHNLQLIISGLSANQDTVVVSWLPQYHDMGLIGSFLGALYCGGSGFYMSPISFIRNPVLWMICMSKYRATHIQSPNFAYALTARKFLAHMQKSKQGSSSSLTIDAATLDLSSVRHMINAAEPVEASSIDLFYAVFSKYGLKNNVIFPTYGLAEHCVYVCSNGSQRLVLDKVALENDRRVKVVKQGEEGERSAVVALGCGRPSESRSVDLRIVDTDGLTVLPEDIVGEIWIKSQSMAAGYWGLPEKSKDDFNASLSEDLGEGSIHGGGESGFLRTGDLGFLHKSELFICGRLKDLIIIRGRNHYPQDIERTAEAIAAVTGGYDQVNLRGGCSAAFSIPISGQEMLWYVAEVSCTKISPAIASGLIDRIRMEINRVHGLSPAGILLLPPRTIPKTTSGKIARQWAKRAYFDGTLNALESWSCLDAQGNDGIEASAVPAQGLMGAIEHDEDAIDPTGQPLEYVLKTLQKAVAICTEQSDSDGIDTDVPLMNLGMDSLRGVQLQSILERKFTVPLPEELMFEADATLRTIGNALIAGGVVRSRPFMLNVWDIVSAMRKLAEKTPKGRPAPPGPLPLQWFRERQRNADVDHHDFPDSCATPTATLSDKDEKMVMVFTALILSGPIVLLLLCLTLLAILPLKVGIATTCILLCAAFAPQSLQVWPPYFCRTFLFEAFTRYFSFRVIVERPVDTNTPTIFAVGPGTPLHIGSILMCMTSEFFLGCNIHMLMQSNVFSFPLTGSFFNLLGCRKDDPKTIRKLLSINRNVCVGLRSPNEDVQSDTIVLNRGKSFILSAMEHGAQIIPCYCFGAPLVVSNASPTLPGIVIRAFEGYLPIPPRSPLVMVIGRPIQCPLIENPTAELVNEYHETYLREMRRIFDKYRNTMNPLYKERGLELKR